MVVDPGVNEASELAVLSQNTHGGVVRTHYIAGQIGDSLQERIEVDLGGEDHASLYEGGQPALGGLLARGLVGGLAHRATMIATAPGRRFCCPYVTQRCVAL